MSKIFGYYHFKPTILRFVKKRQNLQLLLCEKVLLLLTSSIGLSGLLVAVDTFNANSFVELLSFGTHIEYYAEDWAAFYKDHDILIPRVVKEVIQASINNKNRIQSHEPVIGEGVPEKDIIEKTPRTTGQEFSDQDMVGLSDQMISRSSQKSSKEFYLLWITTIL